jgi:ABC-type multidrug transport system fused ATPase/permease subunit
MVCIRLIRLCTCVFLASFQDSTVTVGYETVKDKKVMGGGSGDFEAAKGTVVMKPGVAVDRFEIAIKADDAWETMEQFKVQLTTVEGNATLVGPLISTIYIVDDDQYPQNLKPGFSGFDLFKGFIRERWTTRHPKPIKTLFCMCYATVHGLFSIYIPKVLIDNVIRKGDTSFEGFILAFILCGVLVVSALIYWKLDYKHVDIRGNSGTRKDLRNWILRKYLWFSQNTHVNEIGDTQVVNAMLNQVEELVQNGWFAHYKFIAANFDLLASMVLVFTLDWRAILPILVLLPFATVVFMCRTKPLLRLLGKRVEAERAWLSIVDDCMDNWPLISAYGFRDEVASDFKGVYEKFYKAHRKSRFFQTNSEWIPRVFNEILVAVIFLAGTYLCLHGEMQIGKFTAIVSLYKRIGSRTLRVNRHAVQMMRSTVALEDICRILNTPGDIAAAVDKDIQERARAQKNWHGMRKEVTNKSLPKFTQLTGKAALEHKENVVSRKASFFLNFAATAFGSNTAQIIPGESEQREAERTGAPANLGNTKDQLLSLHSIHISNCTFTYETPGFGGVVPLMTKLDIHVPLGKMIWLTTGPNPGGEACGRLTLMKLMAGLLHPTSGHMDVPAHLKVLFVQHEPMLLAKSLWENLTMGNPDAVASQVWKIAESFGLSELMLNKPDLMVGEHGDNLRLCDRQAVCLARAVIANPDILLLHRPGELFTEGEKQTMLTGVHDWMQRAGGSSTPGEQITGEKTAIMSIDDDADERVPRHCEVVLKVTPEGGKLFAAKEYKEQVLDQWKKEQ